MIESSPYLRSRLLSPALFLATLFLSSNAVADVKQWDFKNSEDYRFDSQKIELKDGAVHLTAVEPKHDAKTGDVDRGSFPADTWATPSFNTADVRAGTFSIERPFVTNNTTVSYAEISEFRERTGADHRGAVSYQVSNNGANWFYHNGRHWVIADGADESNTAAQIQTRVRDLAKELGPGSFYFKAFLYSPTGTEPVELNTVELEYLPNKLTLTAPNGGEKWTLGERQKIRWETSGTSNRVRLEYAVGDKNLKFTSWKPLAQVLRNQGSYEWEVPNDVSSYVKVRILDALDGDVFDVSDEPFKILGRFHFLSPQPGEVLRIDSSYPVKWETLGKVASVKLEYFAEPEIASSATPPRNDAVVIASEAKQSRVFQSIEGLRQNNGTYYWTVPDTISENVRLKISDALEPDTFHVMEATFTILGRLEWDLTKEDKDWPVGSIQTLKWKTTGSITSVNLHYSADGKAWKPLAEKISNTGSYGWTIPDEASENVHLRIEDARYPQVFDEVESKTAIAAEFQFKIPEGRETWVVGARESLGWSTTGKVASVRLEYAAGSQETWKPVAGPIPNTGSFEWIVPDAVSQEVRVKVRDAGHAEAYAVSQPVKIQGTLEVLKPVGEEVWPVASRRTLEWKTTGTIPNVRIELISPDSAHVRGIADSVDNRGQWEWPVADLIADGYRVRVSDVRDPNVSAVSSGTVSIISAFELLSPKGGEEWAIGSQEQIVWQSQGMVPSVIIEYSRDDFYRDVNLIASGIPNSGAAVWTLPDAFPDRLKVRVSDARDRRAFAVSKIPFKIKGKIDFVSPQSEEAWTVLETHPITWKTTGTIPHVRLEFSRDDFQRDIQIIENSLKNHEQYGWKVPDAISTTLKIRVSDTNDPSVFSVSPALKVQGAFHLKEEQAERELRVFGRHLIRWETAGSVPKVRLEYSRDDFTRDIHAMAMDLPNQGAYEWTVPDDIGPGVKIRVADANNLSVFDTTSAPYEIHGSLALSTAVEPERWTVDGEQEITWTTIGNIRKVRLEYSRDEFQNDIRLIAEDLDNQGKFVWRIPDEISKGVRLRIADVSDLLVFSLSKSPVEIAGGLSLVTPKPGEILRVGRESLVLWQTVGSIPAVRLEYRVVDPLRGGKENWKVIAGSTENTRQFSWKVPEDPSNQVRIRVSDTHDPEVFSVSSGNFSILPILELVSPQGSERWIAGTRHDILWRSLGRLSEVRLQFSADHFQNDIQALAEKIPNTGRFVWTVPDSITHDGRIQIQDAADDRVFALSKPFSIAGDFVFVQPSGDSVWKAGTHQKIEWQTVGTIPEVKLEYIPYGRDLPPGEARVIGDKIPNEGSYEWQVPNEMGSPLQLRISDVRDPDVFASSPATVNVVGELQLTMPEGGEVWIVGEEHNLEWKTTGAIRFLALEYSTDGFKNNVQVIEPLLANNNRYLWIIPDAIGAEVQLRIRDARHENLYALSQPFKIRGALALLKPEGSEIWRVGESREIQWRALGTIPKVRLEYSLDEFQTEGHVIESNAQGIDTAGESVQTGVGTYSWTVLDAISERVWIRVADARDFSVAAIGSRPIRIRGGFHMLEPQGGEVWTVGTPQKISWKNIGSVPTVRLEYSRDEFKKEAGIIALGIPNQGSYTWNIPDAVGDRVWVRVADENNAGVSAVSARPFRIRAALEIVTPKGGETWKFGEEQAIQWKTIGTIPQVRIGVIAGDRSSDAWTGEGQGEGQLQYGIIQERVTNQGSYTWRPAGPLAPKIKIRVSDPNHPDVFTETPASIDLLGSLRLVSPVSLERWTVQSTQEIAWETAGYIPQVRIEYSRDGFAQDIGMIQPLGSNEGVLRWTVPDIITKNLLIRVADAAHPYLYAMNPVPLEVVGELSVVNPRGGEERKVGGKVNLEWLTTGSIPYVQLEFSKDRFQKDRQVIEEKFRNNGQYSWTVPDTIAENVWLRVADESDSTVEGFSEPFSVTGSLSLRSPQGGEIIRVGDEFEIFWDTVGTVPQVSLEYSSDNFETVATIARAIPNQGKFSWLVPDRISNDVRVRIFDTNGPHVESVSPAAFKIQGVLSFIRPQEGESWKVGTPEVLQWYAKGSIPHVHLEYSADDFATVMPVILNLQNEGHFTWSVPDMMAGQVKFRISDADDQSVYALSRPVDVAGALQVLIPAGDEVWYVGNEQEVRWKTTGTIPHVRIEASRDGFRNEIRVLEASLKNNNYFSWKIPNWMSPAVQIRIADARKSSVSVTSDPFKILGRLVLTQPIGGEIWRVGSKQIIRWENQGDLSGIKLEYSFDQFKTAVPVTVQAGNSGSYVWKVPDLAGNEIWIRASDAGDPTIHGVSHGPVRVQGNIALLRPHGGEIWKVGHAEVIAWETTGTIPKVDLEYSDNDFYDSFLIADDLPNTGNFSWLIPNLNAKNLKIRVLDSVHPEISDTIHQGIQIYGNLGLTSPIGGEVWLVGTEHSITWTSHGPVEKIRLEYSTDAFKTLHPIVMGFLNEGRYLWKVPDIASKDVRVRLSDDANPGVLTENQKPFEVRPLLSMTSPAGGEVWSVASRQVISWLTVGTVPQVRLEYSTDDFTNHIEVIAASTTNQEIYYWEIPAISGNARVRVSDAANGEVADISRDAFRVAGHIDLISPDWGGRLKAGERVDILWKATPNIKNVKLEYSIDDFKSLKEISAVVPNNGKFIWNVPDKVTDNLRLRISDAEDAAVFAYSKMPVQVRGSLEFISPKEEETWLVGTQQTLQWRTYGTVPRVRIEYSGDDFETVVALRTDTENSGRFIWTVNEVLHPSIRFRVMDVYDPTVQASTPQRILITGQLALLSPQGGERWITGEEQTIRWQTQGLIPRVDLEYSKDRFKDDIHWIASGIANKGSHVWPIPDDRSRKVYVRVRNTENKKIEAISADFFEIGYRKIRWVIRDSQTHDHLSSLIMTDSTGKTQSGLKSPVYLEYPYGIHTAIWSKPGYKDFRNTWLVDRDQTFTVELVRTKEATEIPRVNFEYDPLKDLTKVTSWFEREGRPVAAVVYTEIRIYEGTKLVKTLLSARPDSEGYFHMVWDTRMVPGDSHYLASASLITATGQMMTSPIHYQVRIPVKGKIRHEPRTKIPSTRLKPVEAKNKPEKKPEKPSTRHSERSPTSPLTLRSSQRLRRTSEESARRSFSAVRHKSWRKTDPSSRQESRRGSPRPLAAGGAESTPDATPLRMTYEEASPSSDAAAKKIESHLIAPTSAVLNEIISILYAAAIDADPVVDIYDANRKLVVRGAPMTAGAPGRFSYLLPIKGIAFIPGKSINVTVIERKTARFKTASILIQTPSTALGWEKEVGGIPVGDILRRLDKLIVDFRHAADDDEAKMPEVLASLQHAFSDLVGVLTAKSLNDEVIEKLNHVAEELAKVADKKGYDASHLVRDPLGPQAVIPQIYERLRDFESTIERLSRLYYYSVARA